MRKNEPFRAMERIPVASEVSGLRNEDMNENLLF